jgi:DNA-binding transcriptional LysR family regulator
MKNLVGMAIFARVAEAKSFSEAARRLGLSKSMVSKEVTKLEKSLGARLLNRTTRNLSLTEIGAAFYEHCARVVQEAEEAELVVGRLHGEPRGALKLTTPVAFGTLHIAPALPEFLAQYPDVSIDLTISDRVFDLAEEGYDLSIRIARELPPTWSRAHLRRSIGSCVRRRAISPSTAFRRRRRTWSTTTAWSTRTPILISCGAFEPRAPTSSCRSRGISP